MKLLELRRKHNLSQFEVARALGIPQTTYSGYETGNRKPSPDMLCSMAEFFHVSVDSLIEHTPQLFDDARTSKPEILYLYDKLSLQKQQALLEYARYLDAGK